MLPYFGRPERERQRQGFSGHQGRHERWRALRSKSWRSGRTSCWCRRRRCRCLGHINNIHLAANDGVQRIAQPIILNNLRANQNNRGICVYHHAKRAITITANLPGLQAQLRSGMAQPAQRIFGSRSIHRQTHKDPLSHHGAMWGLVTVFVHNRYRDY